MLRHEVKGGGDRHISNGVFLCFGFDCSKLLVSTLVGNSQDALNSETSDEWASRFLFICLMLYHLNFDAGPHCTILSR